MLWAVANSSFYLMIFLLCLSYQYHALLASAVPSNYTASDILHTTSVHGRGVTNTTVTMNDGVSVDFLERGVPLLSPPSKAKSWPAVDDLSSSTRHYRVITSKAHRDDPVTIPCRDNCSSHMDVVSPRNRIPSASLPLVTSNGSTNLRLPPIHRQVQRRVQRPRRKRRGVIKIRKLLGVYHHPKRLPSDRTGTGTAVIAIGSVLSILLCPIAGILLWCMCSNLAKSTAIDLEEDEPIMQSDLHQLATGPRRYSYSELAAATSNFAQGKRIGRGGFGSVYCGYIDEHDRHVAVKMLSTHSLEQGSMEFEAEVKIMSQLRHRNVVQLVGWCDSRKGLLLVYELVPGGSLDKHLYDPEKVLTWQERYKIALGLCSAIQYLHMDCNQCVVHGDIKPSNVMLDSSNNAKLGDFGLARLVDHGAEPQTTQVVAGTIGYMDPEFVSSQKRGTESDVYSFGIVLLEIACGRRPMALGQSVEATMLLKRVRSMYDRNRILHAADVRLGGNFEGNQMERVLLTGLWCAHHDKGQRPSITQAMSALRCENCAELPVLSAMHSPGQMHHMEEQAYRDLSTESSWSMCLSTVSAYHTAEPSTLHAQE